MESILFRIIFFTMLLLTSIYFSLKDELFNSNTIILGTSVPKTGIMKNWGKAVESGASAYFNFANESQLLKKQKIEFIVYDDKYEPTLTHENFNKLTQNHHLFSFFGFVGTPTVKNILPELENSQTPFIAPFTGGEFLRNGYYKNIINFRSSYKEEIQTLVNYLYDKKGITKFAVFYQNDDYGEEGYVSLISALKQKSLSLVAEGTYKRNTLSIDHAFNEIKNSQPEALIMVGAYKANALFIKKAKQNENFKNTLFCTLSFGDANAMIQELNQDAQQILFSQVVPSYNNTNIPVIKEYQTLMQRYYPNQPLGFISLEAFLAAKTVVNALSNINGYITREKFISRLQTLPANHLDGINTKFEHSQLLNKVYLFEYKEQMFQEVPYEK